MNFGDVSDYLDFGFAPFRPRWKLGLPAIDIDQQFMMLVPLDNSYAYFARGNFDLVIRGRTKMISDQLISSVVLHDMLELSGQDIRSLFPACSSCHYVLEAPHEVTTSLIAEHFGSKLDYKVNLHLSGFGCELLSYITNAIPFLNAISICDSELDFEVSRPTFTNVSRLYLEPTAENLADGNANNLTEPKLFRIDLRSLPRLRRFGFNGTDPWLGKLDSLLNSVRGYQQLEAISFESLTITDESAARLARQLNGSLCHELRLINCEFESINALRTIAAMLPGLKFLDIRGSRFGYGVFREPRNILEHISLERLDISETDMDIELSDFLLEISRNGLECFSANGCLINDSGNALSELLNRCNRLTYLDLSNIGDCDSQLVESVPEQKAFVDFLGTRNMRSDIAELLVRKFRSGVDVYYTGYASDRSDFSDLAKLLRVKRLAISDEVALETFVQRSKARNKSLEVLCVPQCEIDEASSETIRDICPKLSLVVGRSSSDYTVSEQISTVSTSACESQLVLLRTLDRLS